MDEPHPPSPTTTTSTREWPCFWETRGPDGIQSYASIKYDADHNELEKQVTTFKGMYGTTETWTKTFTGNIAVTEDYQGVVVHDKFTRDVQDGRIIHETQLQLNEDDVVESIWGSDWIYDTQHRLMRIDRKDLKVGIPRDSSVFTYPDANARVERACSIGPAGELCSLITLIGGVDTWTTYRYDETADGITDYERTRTLDKNGLPIAIEGAKLDADGTRHVDQHIVIQRRDDGTPLTMDDGDFHTEYEYSCN